MQMYAVEEYDVLILGSGQGGKLLAWHLARSGKRVAVVERQWVGGSCPAVACLPSKNEIWSARVAHLAQHAAQFGTITGPVTTDMAKVRGRKQGMVDGETAFHLEAYRKSGAELIMGTGRFIGPKTLAVELNDGGERVLSADQIFINVGTHATVPDIPGLTVAQPMTHIRALELDYLPEHLVVLGGGYVGLEMAQAYRRFGSRVTVVEPGQRLMSREDADVSKEMLEVLSSDDIRIVLQAKPVKAEGLSGKSVRITVETLSGQQVIEGSDILVAVGARRTLRA
jgi:pyruvate/2-oxoglutarate dehydrogenase complex dihydrolipoamide dehydrogenase (E3) component